MAKNNPNHPAWQLDQRYQPLLEAIKHRIQSARIRVARAACREQINLYWWIGQQIVESQEHYGWGHGVVEQLAQDLQQAFEGTTYGFSKRNLWDMRRFYLAYRDCPNLRQLVAEIPWGQHLLILSKVKDTNARAYYLHLTNQMGLTRRQLIQSIQTQTYERHYSNQKQHNFNQTLSSSMAEQADQSMKDIYMLDTLGLTAPVLESQIEYHMVGKIKSVMLELGYGFTFVGHQYRVNVPNGKDVFIDLLFFNRRLRALIAMELKTGKFEPEYAGKMNYYLNILDDQVKEAWENPSIGIILCSDKDHIDVEYALRGLEKPVGVSEYRLTKQLPEEFNDKLPDPKRLEQALRREMDWSQT